MTRLCLGASIIALAGAALCLAPASAFTLNAPSPGQAALPIERVWWDQWGRWHPDAGWRPAQPHYHCWKPLHGPRRCQFDY